MESKHVIGILGAAVAGSEAARIAADRGALVVVVDQGVRPYGKIEDGLPRWHVALRNKEFERINENLSHPNILFVPMTKVGRDVSWEALIGLGFSVTILANGAWRDRPLPAAIDAFSGRGLLYQNAFVQWFQHAREPGYAGPRYAVPDRAIVVGGGLASIDVAKIINFSLCREALAARGIQVEAEEMEHTGIPAICAAHGIVPESLGVYGATLFYRRRAEDMPLVSSDDNNAARMAKLEATRVKLLEKVLTKYLVRFEPLASPVAPIVVSDGAGGERLGGIVFRRNAVDGKNVTPIAGSDFEVRCDLVVSSIGSIPELIPGVPTKGELLRWRDQETGELDQDGRTDIFGIGNVLTGKGNIVESRKSAKSVMGQIADGRLGLARLSDAEAGALVDASHAEVRAHAEAVVNRALAGVEPPPERVVAIKAWVASRWAELGYTDFASWIAAHPPYKEAQHTHG